MVHKTTGPRAHAQRVRESSRLPLRDDTRLAARQAQRDVFEWYIHDPLLEKGRFIKTTDPREHIQRVRTGSRQ